MNSIKEIVQRHRNRTLIPLVIILSIIALLSSIIPSPIIQIPPMEITNYLIPGVLVVIALIASFTFFYSGKMIDYKRDYIQRVADLEEVVAKTKRWLDIIENSNIQVDNCKHFVDQINQHLQDPNKRITFTSLQVNLLSIIIIGLIFVPLAMINSPYLDLPHLIYAAVVLFIIIFYFIKIWFMYEEIIIVYNNDLIFLNRFIGTLKGIND